MILPSIKYDFTILRRVIMTLILLKTMHTFHQKNMYWRRFTSIFYPIICWLVINTFIFEYSRCGAFVSRQNLIQLIGSNERIFGNIPEHILHRSHNRDTIITIIKDTKSRASCECFTLIFHIYFLIRLHHVLRENNEHLIISNGRRNRKLLKFNYK